MFVPATVIVELDRKHSWASWKDIPGDLQRERLNRVAKECTVKPPNNGLFGGSNVVRCREVVRILEVIEATPPIVASVGVAYR